MVVLSSDAENNAELINTFKDKIQQKINLTNINIKEPQEIGEKSKQNKEFIQYQIIEKPIADIVNVPTKELFHTPQNFDKFIKECLEINKDATASGIDITSRYRIWSRSKNDFRELLIEYLKNKGFKEVGVYDPISKCNLTCYQGINVIPLDAFTITQNSTEIEKFLFENCITSITGRISSKEIFETFFTWKNTKDPSYIKITNNDKKLINTYLNKNFMGSTVYTGERIRFGFYGLCLKNKESELVGTKQKPKNRKIIQ